MSVKLKKITTQTLIEGWDWKLIELDSIQARSNLNFSVKSPIIQFYTIKHDF
jgi:hypothetical protein